MDKIRDISIILVGSWNVKIFTPGWMMSELLNLNSNDELEIGFNKNLQPIFKYKKVHFTPTERSFDIRFEEISNETINIANNAVLKLIAALPFTPNLLVGYNYKVKGEFNIDNVSIPNFTDKYLLQEIKLTKEEANYKLNVILACGEEKTTTYNFHYLNLSFIKDNTIHEHIEYLKNHGI